MSKQKRMALFGLVSLCAELLWGALYLVLIGMTSLPAAVCEWVALLIAALFDVCLTRAFVFCSDKTWLPLIGILPYAAGMSRVGILAYKALTDGAEWGLLPAVLVCAVANLPFEFLFQRFLLFEKHVDTKFIR